jgi:hypothetical protein
VVLEREYDGVVGDLESVLSHRHDDVAEHDAALTVDQVTTHHTSADAPPPNEDDDDDDDDEDDDDDDDDDALDPHH